MKWFGLGKACAGALFIRLFVALFISLFACPVQASENLKRLLDCSRLLDFTHRNAKKVILESPAAWDHAFFESKPRSLVLESFISQWRLPIYGEGILAKALGDKPAVLVETKPDWQKTSHQWRYLSDTYVKKSRDAQVNASPNVGWQEDSRFAQSAKLLPSISVDEAGVRRLVYPKFLSKQSYRLLFRTLGPDTESKEEENTPLGFIDIEGELLDFKLVPGSERVAAKIRRPNGDVVLAFYCIGEKNFGVSYLKPRPQLVDGAVLLPPIPPTEEHHRKFSTASDGSLVLMDDRMGSSLAPRNEDKIFSMWFQNELLYFRTFTVLEAQNSNALVSKYQGLLRFGNGNVIRREPWPGTFEDDLIVEGVEKVTDVLEHPTNPSFTLVAGRNSQQAFTLNFINLDVPDFQSHLDVSMGTKPPRFSAVADGGGWFVSVWNKTLLSVFRADQGGLRRIGVADLHFDIESAGVTLDGQYLYATGISERGPRVLISTFRQNGDEGGGGGGEDWTPIPESGPQGGMALPLAPKRASMGLPTVLVGSRPI